MSGERSVLFVTWDGPKSAYLQTLFLPIFSALREFGYRFHVLQFSWSDEAERAALAAECMSAGASYEHAAVWRRPVGPGALATALLGGRKVRRAANTYAIDILMPRSIMPALATMRARLNLPILLDADGLPNDERVEFAGESRNGLRYRLLSQIEALSVRRAKVVTVRTRRAAQILTARADLAPADDRFHLVANGRDEWRFTPIGEAERAQRRTELGLTAEQPLVIYVGSAFSGKYDGHGMLRFFAQVLAQRSDARLLLLMPDQSAAAQLLANQPDLRDACILRTAPPHEVPGWIGCADLGLALIHATFSMQAAAAIKTGEYLLCGVPVLAYARMGDTDEMIDDEVGLCINEPDEAAFSKAASWLLSRVLTDRDGFRRRCRAVGVEHYALSTAVRDYANALADAVAKNE